MLRKTSILAAFALVSSASLASAGEHVVLFLGDAFFPEVTYVDPGDTIRFVNSSGAEMNVVSEESDWSVGPIAADDSKTMQVNPNMKLNYFDAGSQDEQGNLMVQGTISFDPAPEG